jgi:hypothetical protein
VLPENITIGQVEVWFQDETRVGQQGSLTRIWAIKGTRPRVVRQQQFLSTYIYGAVCPQRQVGAALIMPYANSDCMNLHLIEISHRLPVGIMRWLSLTRQDGILPKNLLYLITFLF